MTKIKSRVSCFVGTNGVVGGGVGTNTSALITNELTGNYITNELTGNFILNRK